MINGIISDGTTANLPVTQSGNGVWTLAGANTYSGGTTLSVGGLVINNNSALGSGTLTINGGTLDSTVANIDLGGTGGYNNPQNWNASFAFLGTHSLRLGDGNVALTNNPTVTVVQSTLTVNGAISGTSSLTKAGSGTLVLQGANSTYSNGTTVSAGILETLASNALGAGGLTMGNGTLDMQGYSATVASLSGAAGLITNINGTGNSPVLTVNQQSVNTTYSGRLSDGATPLGLLKGGSGMLTLSASNGYSGGTRILAGTLQVRNSAALGSSSGALAVNGGTLDLGGYSVTVASFSGGGSYVTNSSGTASLTVNQSGNTTFNGTLSNGAGTLALLKSGGGLLNLGPGFSNNTYSGGTTVSGGTLQLNYANALGAAGLTVNGGMVDLNGNPLHPSWNSALPYLSGAGTAAVITDNSSGATTLLDVNQATNTTFAGSIQNGAGPHDHLLQGQRRQPDAHRQQHVHQPDDQWRHVAVGHRHKRPGRLNRRERRRDRQCRLGLQPLRHADGRIRHQRQRHGDQAGWRHARSQWRQQLRRRHERQQRHTGLRRQQRPADFRHGERQWRRAEHVEL